MQLEQGHSMLRILVGVVAVAAAVAAQGADATTADPKRTSRDDRQALSVLVADKNVMQSALFTDVAAVDRRMVNASCRSLYRLSELATPKGLQAIKGRMDQCRALQEEAAKSTRGHWQAWRARIQKGDVPAELGGYLLKSYEKAEPRLMEKQAAALQAWNAHANAVADIVSFGQRFAGKLKVDNSTLVLPGGAPIVELSKLQREANDADIAYLRAQRIADGQRDESTYLIQCALDGHTSVSVPSINDCVARARVARAKEQLFKEMGRLEGAPVLDEITAGSMPDNLMSNEGQGRIRKLTNEVQNRALNAILAFESVFAELENALADANFPEDQEMLKRLAESVRDSKVSIDAQFTADMETGYALEELVSFFENHLGGIQKTDNGFDFSSFALRDEYTKIMDRFKAAHALARKQETESNKRLNGLNKTTTI